MPQAPLDFLPEIARDVYLPATAFDRDGELLGTGTALLDENGSGRFQLEIPRADLFEVDRAHRLHFHSGTVIVTHWYRCEPGDEDDFHFLTEEIAE